MENNTPINTHQDFEDNTKIFLCVLEGIKTRLKNMHWNTNKLSIHTQIDEVLIDINNAQDAIAEEIQGIFGKYDDFFLKSIIIEVEDYSDMLGFIKDRFISYGNSLPDSIIYASIRGTCEDIIGKLNVYEYLTSIILGRKDYEERIM